MIPTLKLSTETELLHPENPEKYVPVQWIKREVTRRYVTTEEDEFRTNSLCPDCYLQLYTVAEYRNDRFYEVRGLKRCYDLRCWAMPLKHRDVVGAKMIFRRFKGDGPATLNRGSDVPWNDPKDKNFWHILWTPPLPKSVNNS